MMIEIGRSSLAYLVGGAVVSISVALFIRKKRTKKVYPADVVVLHQFSRGFWAPSFSPFVIKLETYLRMNKIPYENDHSGTMSSKGKIPWITYNDIDMDDSQFCIEYLNNKFDKDLNKHLTPEQKATARAFQKMTEENLYWILGLWFWVYGDWEILKTGFKLPSLILMYIFSRYIKKCAWYHGIGRHSREEVIHIGSSDLRALSAFLGSKKFLMGFSPSEVDCAVFGVLAPIKWHTPGSPYVELLNGELKNLSDYCDRMKERFWPDWDDCITHGGTRAATK